MAAREAAALSRSPLATPLPTGSPAQRPAIEATDRDVGGTSIAVSSAGAGLEGEAGARIRVMDLEEPQAA